ncbi:MAG: succinate dehydrogenase/fumarate reductase iron-sulfur subunit [Pirellulaceae bacterium]|nr:succinate dehydrogenase/fumarate reductase iron-sulfur subunit [Pirellulaceae bacterium]
MADSIHLKIFRSDGSGVGEMVDYTIPADPGMVILDAVHKVQAMHANDLAVRWNCKAGKCGSCSAEVNGRPKLMCMDRLDKYPPGETISIRPMKSFPVMKDLVCDVSWNYRVNKKIPAFKMKASAQADPRFTQEEADRVQEFRKCIECFLCQDVCHVVREHDLKEQFAGPRFLVRAASLEMHPLDDIDRIPMIKQEMGIGYCNITKCCTEVCPENITITDNAIIPLKERVVDRFYDPVKMILYKIMPKRKKPPTSAG